MIKINVLESRVYNQISAGEVVERPSSVVKEIVENSIDAGASEIEISIFDGGISQIIVNDNGVGIASSEVEKAFLSHATSKILETCDLEKIATLGFRGEALASIASVSKIEMQTKTLDEEVGVKITLDGGKVVSKENIARSNGTTICVSNLFYNVPARLKFLKKSQYEAMNITQVVSNLVLANPNVSFKYYSDNNLLIHSTGQGLESAIRSIYKQEFLDNLIKVDYIKDNIKVFGYIGKKTFVKANRNYQTFIINDRFVKNQTVSAALLQAYQGFLMTNKFPVAILNILVPFEEVDVNVHPSKVEVRFSDNQTVFKAVYNAVRSALDSQNDIANFAVFEDSKLDKKVAEDFLSFKVEESKNETSANLFDKEIGEIARGSQNKIISNSIETISKENIFETQKPFQELDNNISYKFIGSIFDTYLLVEIKDLLILIDAHAAHEKILYDKLKIEIDKKKFQKQMLLMPHILKLGIEDSKILSENIDKIKSIGIEIDELSGDIFKINAVPLIVSNINLDEFFFDILKNSSMLFKQDISEFLIDKIAQKACKAAVKGNTQLNNSEIEYLLELFLSLKPTQCPHGRPTMYKLSKKDLDKNFKRIL